MNGIYLYGKYLILKTFSAWFNSSILINFIKVALVYLWALFIGIHSYIFCILALIIIDVVFGIKASLKQGKPYKTRILRKGLLEKFVLYFGVILIAFILDTVLQNGIQFSQYYVTFIGSAMISFYEASSIVEKLIIIYPEVPFLKRLARLLNVLDTEVEKKTTALITDGEVIQEGDDK
jgi:phage-related holin